MANTQILSSKFLSLRDQRWIHGEHGRLLFEASRPRIFGRTIELRNPLGLVVATINPQPWKSPPCWQISSGNDNYTIKQNIKSFQRFYQIEAGLFDGVIVEGGHYDQQFRIRHGDEILAQAKEEMYSLKGKHVIEVMDGSEQINVLSAVVSVIISKEKQDSRSGRDRN